MRSILQLLKCFSLFALTLLSSFCKKKKTAFATFAVCQHYSFQSLISPAKKFTLELQHDFIEEIIKFTAHILIFLLARLSVVWKSWLLLYFFFITLFWTHTKACRNRRRYLLAVYQPVISVSIFLKMWDALTLDIIMSTAMFCIKLDFLYCPLNYSGASDHGYTSLQRKWTPNGLLLE